MSRTKVIITKFLLSKFSYVLYDLGFFDDIMADEESSSSSRSTSEKRKEPSRSEDQEDSPQKRRKDVSRPREDSCSSPVTLGLFHDFLGKLDDRFNEIEQCLKMSARGLKRGWNLSHGLGLSGDNDPDRSESKSQDGAKAHLPSFHALGEEPLASKRVRYDDVSSISTVSTFSLPSQSIHPRVIDEEEYQQFGSDSDDDFSTGNSHRNDPEVLSPSALESGRLRLRPRPVFPDMQTQVHAHTPSKAELHSQVEANRPCNVQPSDQSSNFKEQEELYFDPVKKSDSSLSFDTDDQIKDFYTRYRDNRLSKETLSEIKKDLPIPNIDDLVHPKINPVIRGAKSFQANKHYGINDHKLTRIQDQAISAACPILYLWQNFKNETDLSYEEILKMLQQSLVFLGSVNANINSFRRESLSNVLSKDFSSLVYDQSIKHGEFLFGTDLADKIEKQSKEQKLISKITTDPFPKGSRPSHTSYIPARSFRPRGGGQKPNQTLRRVFIKKKFPPKQKQRDPSLKDPDRK